MTAERVKVPIDKERIQQDITELVSRAAESGFALPCIFEKSIDSVSFLDWLRSRPEPEHFYWRGRDGECEVAGAGLALAYESGRSTSALEQAERVHTFCPECRTMFFGGRRFDTFTSSDPIWADFPGDTAFIPSRALVRSGQTTVIRLCLPVTADTDIGRAVTKACEFLDQRPSSSSSNISLPDLVSVTHHPDFEGWCDGISRVFDRIRSGQAEKVVLARRSDYHFADEVDPVALLAQLQTHNDNCYTILYRPSGKSTFISVTPERLYRRRGRKIQIDALSSTERRGDTEVEDRMLEKALLESEKQRREHRYVVEGILRALSPLCERAPESSPTTVRKLNRLQHLATPISCRLRAEINDDAIIAALHPTPAVGGVPGPEAGRIISEIEGFDRGWYAGAIGYMTAGEAELAVGIRSAVISGATVSVFTGAGIVSGSIAENEWMEINGKDILLSIVNGEAK